MTARNQAALELYQKGFRDAKVVCYCSGVDHATSLYQLFRQAGVPSGLITGDTDPDDRREILEEFRTGQIRVLMNARVLIEGFDEDTCSVAFNLHPTLSALDAEQRGGRPLRIDPSNPAKVGYVVDFIDANSKRPAVLFSEILGGASVTPAKQQSTELKEGTPLGANPKEAHETRRQNILSRLPIDGLRVIVDAREILRVNQEYSEQRENIEKPNWTFEELQAEVRAAGVTSSYQYNQQYSSKKWPANTSITKNPEWRSWDEFLGREARKNFSFEDLKADVKLKGITKSSDYNRIYKDYGWPANDVLKRKYPEFTTWDEFFGRKIFTYEEVQSIVKKAKIKNSREYTELSKLGTVPGAKNLSKLPEWKGWDEFFGREERPTLTLEEIRVAVQDAHIKNYREYAKFAAQNNWPGPQTIMKDSGWKGWDDFLGRTATKTDTSQE